MSKKNLLDLIKQLIIKNAPSQELIVPGSKTTTEFSTPTPENQLATFRQNYDILKKRLEAKREQEELDKIAKKPVILCDTSWSMGEGDTHTRMDMLHKAMDHLAKDVTFHRSPVVRFSSDFSCHTLTPEMRFEPHGATRLCQALNHVLECQPNNRTILISDGEPRHPEKCLKIAENRFELPIHTIFCGDEQHHKAQYFMKELARVTSGTYISVGDLIYSNDCYALVHAVKHLTALPAPHSN